MGSSIQFSSNLSNGLQKREWYAPSNGGSTCAFTNTSRNFSMCAASVVTFSSKEGKWFGLLGSDSIDSCMVGVGSIQRKHIVGGVFYPRQLRRVLDEHNGFCTVT